MGVICASWFVPPIRGQDLEQRLLTDSAVALAREAATSGDALRGAIVFHQPYMACVQCHSEQASERRIGPDLRNMDPKPSDEELVDSVIRPSKRIKKGYESLTIVTTDGRVVQGTLVKRDDQAVVLADVAKNLEPVRVPAEEIDSEQLSEQSIMPAGQVKVLSSRQQFLDLTRYLMEIRDGGIARARELEPPPALYAAAPLPEYEQLIDHAGMIRELDDEAAARGADIYTRVCANCHGTHDRPGSLPTSLNFASGKFKNGSDPYTMYQTLTRGFGLMVPQTWMVPEQKYDVIHYIREHYLQTHNASQYFQISPEYLSSLPQGTSRGPKPRNVEPWQEMDYGPNLVATYEIGDDGTNFAYKGNAVRLDPGPGGVSRGNAWMIVDFDTLRMAAAWSGQEFIDYNGINFNGQHAIHPRVTGTVHFANPTAPGWARPGTDSFEDTRLVGRDGRRYGPLPRDWAQYRGMYYCGNDTVVSYTVGNTAVLETQSALPGTDSVFARHFEIGPRDHDLLLQVLDAPEFAGRVVESVKPPSGSSQSLAHVVLWGSGAPLLATIVRDDATSSAGSTAAQGAVLAGLATSERSDVGAFEWLNVDGSLRLRICKGDGRLRFTQWMTRVETKAQSAQRLTELSVPDPSRDLDALTRGGPPRWTETVTTEVQIDDDSGPFAVDTLTHPQINPWLCRMRLTGHDFYSDADRAAVCDWDGNVWLVTGLAALHRNPAPADAPKLTWKRIASGLFQPLGLRIIDDVVHLTCRDQLCRLHDLNGDDAIDWYECVNNDHQVTDHFHEFAMGLQTDREGNFYYAKSARHALPAVVPQHGTLLRISQDGSKTDILATGFRAANGVCLNADGTFFVTDQEGHWNPKNRINWVKPGGFYGNMYGYHDVTDASDSAMDQPLCWITNSFDRSPAEPVWVESNAWGPLSGRLLNISYGYGKVFLVPHETIAGQAQGGMIELPIPQFPTGTIRGRFHPADGQLYLTGMFSWAGNQEEPGGMFRLRYTGKPVHLPVELHAKRLGLELEFTGDLDPVEAAKVGNYQVKIWDLQRTSDYGSEHFNERWLSVSKATLVGRRLTLEVPDIRPTWCMEIRYRLKTSTGEGLSGVIHNTIHHLGTDDGGGIAAGQ
jgi:putative heme-binding domain-containing protein